MEYLKQVIVCLGPERREQADALCDALKRENIRCGRYPEEDILEEAGTGCPVIGPCRIRDRLYRMCCFRRGFF